MPNAAPRTTASNSAFFESLYQADTDPWRFGSDPTELARYDAILAALGPHRYHWLGQSPDHQISGDAVHAVLHKNTRLHHEHAERHATFRLDRWRRV